jgi:DNA-binding XRE family transcriptional regulator
MKTKPNKSLKALRKIIGKTQAEFAAFIGVSNHTVVAWENGLNKLPPKMARRVFMATGADVQRGDGSILTYLGEDPYNHPRSSRRASKWLLPHVQGDPYTRQYFERWTRAFHRSGDFAVKDQVAIGKDTLELVLTAAANIQGGKVGNQLPAVWESFREWLIQTREDFKLGPAIDNLLTLRRHKETMKTPYSVWREAKAEGHPMAQSYGFVDDPTKPDDEELTLEVDAYPMWTPGQDMRPDQEAHPCLIPKSQKAQKGQQ